MGTIMMEVLDLPVGQKFLSFDRYSIIRIWLGLVLVNH